MAAHSSTQGREKDGEGDSVRKCECAVECVCCIMFYSQEYSEFLVFNITDTGLQSQGSSS